MWQIAAQKCKLCGLRVLLFLLTHKNQKEWTAENFISWMSMEYQTGRKNWREGITDLVMQGLIEWDGQVIQIKRILKQ